MENFTTVYKIEGKSYEVIELGTPFRDGDEYLSLSGEWKPVRPNCIGTKYESGVFSAVRRPVQDGREINVKQANRVSLFLR